MAAAASRQGERAPFSFHCTICYDAFNLTDRAPVVLPCGHTYLCEPCSKRLERCMECRTPLFTKVKKETPHETPGDVYSSLGHSPRSRASSMRSSSSSSHISSSHRPLVFENIPLPIPKNHVLMCLIDAVQKTSGNELDTEGYESGDDDELVLRGMKVMGSSSGTYVIRERKGLTVHPVPPKANKKKTMGGADTRVLKYGQTVQIFLFDNKIATIARGAGYILVDHPSQLVKVGEVTDEACKMEATGKVIETEIQGLEKETRKLRRALETVDEQLKKIMSVNDNNTVFGPVPDDRLREELLSENDTNEEKKTMSVTRKDPTLPPVAIPAESDLKKEPAVTKTQSFEVAPVSMFCVPSIEPSRSFGNFAKYLLGQKEEHRQSQYIMSNYFATYWSGAQDESDTRSISSQSSRSSSSRQNSAINFASGLSGHSGLNVGPRHSDVRRPRKVMAMSNY